MRRRVAFAVALVAIVAAAPGPTTTRSSAASGPERLLVRGLEYELRLSKQRLVPGRAIIQFVNGGEDAHDLRIQRLGGGREFGFAELAPGEYESLDRRLRRKSRYVLWCSLSDHRALGMEATLRTKKRRR